MIKWEYKVVNVECKGFWGGQVDQDTLEDRLNQLGEAGWELTSTIVTAQNQGQTKDVKLVFKRIRESY